MCCITSNFFHKTTGQEIKFVVDGTFCRGLWKLLRVKSTSNKILVKLLQFVQPPMSCKLEKILMMNKILIYLFSALSLKPVCLYVIF